jgi:hypothetical protein
VNKVNKFREEMSMSMLNVNMEISMSMEKQMKSMCEEVSIMVIRACASKYNFDGEEACRMLSLSVGVDRKVGISRKKSEKSRAIKARFPLPFNGELNDSLCYGLRQNNGLYTQCQISRKDGKSFCKTCQMLADGNSDGKPDYGTIQDRVACGISEFVDPKGRKPTAYTRIMKKYKITEEDVIEEAKKFNMNIAAEHFVVADEVKRGRPKAEKKAKKESEKQAKGRPKKSKKVIEIEGDEDDLFASLLANVSLEEEEVVIPEVVVAAPAAAAKKVGKSEEEKIAEKAAKKAAEEEAKAAKKAAEEEAKAAKKLAEEEAKAAKKAAEEEAKAAKAAKKLAEEEAKAAKKAADEEVKKAKASKKPKAAKKEEEEEEEEAPWRVSIVKFNGKDYLKDKQTGLVYEKDAYCEPKEGEASRKILVGEWNAELKTVNIIKAQVEEEEEEEYDESSDEEEEEEED